MNDSLGIPQSAIDAYAPTRPGAWNLPEPAGDGVRTKTLEIDTAARARRLEPGLVRVFFEGRGGALTAWPVREALVVGRTADASLEDDALSRRHFEVRATPAGLRVRDLGSRNGTRVGHAWLRNSEAAAPAGTVVRAGLHVFLVSADVRPFLAPTRAPVSPELGGPGMDGVRRAVLDAAGSALPALVLGESGAGKERTARAVHALSGRRGPIVTINCGAIPAQLVESELFGHQRGSFSGSDVARTGLFRIADGGTLFLDEIGELPLPAQAALLRVLDSGEVRPVGCDRPVTVDVRVVAATNRDLEALVREGRFRADLLHRLSGVRVHVPGLRAHREDLVAIALGLLPAGYTLTASAVEALLAHDWPGNVRELKLAILAAVARATRDGRTALVPADLGEQGLEPARRTGAPGSALACSRSIDPREGADAVLRARIETALRIHLGNVTRAARDLEMGRSTIYEAVTRLGIEPGAFRAQAR